MLFISPRKLFSFSRYLSFCLDFLIMQQNGLIEKIRLFSNFTTSQPGQQTFAILILPNISRSKGNQQARNQEVFRAGEFCSNQGISINIHLQREKERPRREKNLPFSRQEAPKNFILNEKFYSQITTIRAFFLQIRALFSSFRNRAGETSPPHPLQLRA